jgi:hypothetical protein
VTGPRDDVSSDFLFRCALIEMPEAFEQERLLRGRELVNAFGSDHGFI